MDEVSIPRAWREAVDSIMSVVTCSTRCWAGWSDGPLSMAKKCEFLQGEKDEGARLSFYQETCHGRFFFSDSIGGQGIRHKSKEKKWGSEVCKRMLKSRDSLLSQKETVGDIWNLAKQQVKKIETSK